MAESKQPAEVSSPRRGQLLVPSGTSSSELSPSGPSDLRPSSLGRISSSSLSSLTVPVRLDVLYFLLNSAAKGAQNALAPTPLPGGSACSCHGPVAPQALSCCCSCHPPLHHAPGPAPYTRPPSEPHNDRASCGSYGLHGRWSPRIPDHQGNKYGIGQRGEGMAWSGSATQADSARGWRNAQSPLGWKENQRGPAGRPGKEDNWPQKQVAFRKPWEDQRRSTAESTPWNSAKRKSEEPLSFGAHSANNKNRGGRCQASWDSPGDKRHSSPTWTGLQKTKGTPEADNFSNKTAAGELTKTAPQNGGEDWEAEYNQQTVDVPVGQQVISPLPKSSSTDRALASTGEELAKPHLNWSKDGEFICYLKSRYADVPQQSSSESSTDLVIDTEASKPEEEEEEKEEEKGCCKVQLMGRAEEGAKSAAEGK